MKFLKGVNKEVKKAFLAKLQSGQYTLGPIYEPQKRITFELQDNGLYQCNETGELMTRDEINGLKGYRGSIDLVSTPDQVTGDKLPDEIILMPFTESEYLDSLLIDKSAKTLIWDESDGLFKTDTDSYTFSQLMKLKSDGSEIDFIMDPETSRKYVECLENWC